MKACSILCLVLVLPPFAVPAGATELLQSSRSAGKMKQDHSVELGRLLPQTELITKARPVQAENFAARESFTAGIANRYDQLFTVYQADVDLVSDLDGDGYHHAINVSFDVDVSYDRATVFAKLYLSREGEPWSQYYTTALFPIDGDATRDTFEVETELVEGYLPGYYAILIEIYSLDHAFLVASEFVDFHYLGRDLTIESLDWDNSHDLIRSGVGVTISAGSMSSLLLILLLLQGLALVKGLLSPHLTGSTRISSGAVSASKKVTQP